MVGLGCQLLRPASRLGYVTNISKALRYFAFPFREMLSMSQLLKETMEKPSVPPAIRLGVGRRTITSSHLWSLLHRH